MCYTLQVMILRSPQDIEVLPKSTRKFCIEDAEELTRAIQVSELHNFVRWPDPYKLSDAKAYLSDITTHWGETNACLAIIEDGRIIGAIEARALIAEEKIKVQADNPEGILSIGYWIHKDYRHQGFASETLQTFIPWLESNLDLRWQELAARTLLGNTASQKILRRNGFEVRRTTEDTIYFRRLINQ